MEQQNLRLSPQNEKANRQSLRRARNAVPVDWSPSSAYDLVRKISRKRLRILCLARGIEAPPDKQLPEFREFDRISPHDGLCFSVGTLAMNWRDAVNEAQSLTSIQSLNPFFSYCQVEAIESCAVNGLQL